MPNQASLAAQDRQGLHKVSWSANDNDGAKADESMIDAVKLSDETSDIAVIESRKGEEDACVAEHISSARNGTCAEQRRIFCSIQ